MLRAFLLTLAGFLLAFGPVLLRRPDLAVWIPLGVMAAGAVWAIRIDRRREKRRLWLALLPAAACAAFLLWHFVLAGYTEPRGIPEPGVEVPDVAAVRVRDGAPFQLAAQRGHGVLLVFFRGGW